MICSAECVYVCVWECAMLLCVCGNVLRCHVCVIGKV